MHKAGFDNNKHMSIKTPSNGHRIIVSNLFKYSCLLQLVFPRSLFFAYSICASFTDYLKSVLDYANVLS